MASSILQRVLDLAADRPDAVALRLWLPEHEYDQQGLDTVSRTELVQLAGSIAASINSLGATEDGPIGLCFCGTTRGVVAAMLATRMLGRMYLPLDAGTSSSERITRLCTAANCICLICDGVSAT